MKNQSYETLDKYEESSISIEPISIAQTVTFIWLEYWNIEQNIFLKTQKNKHGTNY